MPALTSYSPYETLVFFQNVARHGTDALAFQEISATLNENQLIRDGKSYDSSRFSPDALQSLYERLIRAHTENEAKHVNGEADAGVSNSRKRKLSSSPSPSEASRPDEEAFLQSFVDKLYVRFREESIKEIRRDEQEYANIQNEIEDLEKQVRTDNQTNQNVSSQSATDHNASPLGPKQEGDALDSEVAVQEQKSSLLQASTGVPTLSSQPATVEVSKRQLSSPAPPGTATPRSATATPQGRVSQPSHLSTKSAQRASPASVDGNVAQQPNQYPSHGSLPSTHAYPNSQAIQASQAGAPGQSVPQMTPPMDHGVGTSTPTQGRLSPAHYPGQAPYPSYPQYHPGAQQWQSPVPSQPYMHPQYGAMPYYNQAGTPHPAYQQGNQHQYQHFPHVAPGPYSSQQQWRGQPSQSHLNYPQSAHTTPGPPPGTRTPIVRSNSSTPWKRKAPTPRKRSVSPPRFEREVSPLSDHERSRRGSSKRQSGKPGQDNAPPRESRSGRQASATPSAHDVSRSQSVVSRTSETPSEKQGTAKRSQRIKIEAPNTPAPIASDTEQQRSSGRRGRPRKDTATSRPDLPKTSGAQKRKRDSIVSRSPTPVSRSPAVGHAPSTSRRIPSPLDSSLVVVSKNFSKTSQLLLNEITSHKLAGIFAKPLSERDAPGYKELVLQPQDLKSIKAAISKGSRAAAAAIEELDAGENDEDGQATPTSKVPLVAHGEGPIGNGFYFVKKTDDMVPPKGIVNSAQLEMELVRMFANAVMFNPLPSSERGFGRNLRLRRMGGDILPDQDTDASDTASSEGDSTPSGDEGGIIADAREMFEDVAKLVERWRDLEGERLSDHSVGATPGGTEVQPAATGPRHASVSVSSVMHEEEDDASAGVATPGAAVSTMGRKRRRIGDH